MKNLHYITTKAIFSMILQQMTLQQQLIDAQQKIVELQKRIDDMTPKTPSDQEVFWHIASKGTLSLEAANSDDITTVRKFRDWNVEFAKRFVQPYVDPNVFSECVNQMTRGLSERIVQLEKKSETGTTKSMQVVGELKQLSFLH